MGNATGQDTVYCFDATTGSPIWKHSYPCGLRPQYYEGGTSSTPTVDGDQVYTLGKEGQLFCFGAANGQIFWQKNLTNDPGATLPRWAFAGSPLVQGDLLILNAGIAGAALDKRTGQVAWFSGKGLSGYATPVPITMEGQSCVLIFSSKALVCVSVADGRQLWSFPWVTKWDLNIADPIVSGDRVFISTFDQGAALLKVDRKGATELWRNKNLANHFSSSVLYEGFVYGIDGNTDRPPADLRCLDLATGAVRWKQAGFGFGALMIADSKLLVISDKGELVVANAKPDSFRELARAQVLGGKCWITPVLSNGLIYCRNAQGALVCLDVRSHD
jgi:outer membrane protein assembly factor BamB